MTSTTFVLAFIGLAAGLLGGMLGVGGSVVMIPAMTELLGPNQHRYQAAAMIVNFFVVVPAVYQHRRNHAIDLATVVRMLPIAVIGVLSGVALSELSIFAGDGEVYLRGLFGLFLVGTAGMDLRRRRRIRQGDSAVLADDHAASSTATQPTRGRWRLALAVAAPTGLVGGLLGVGGGVVAVPLQRRWLKIPMRVAIANSAAVIVATSFAGALMKNYAYARDTGNLWDSVSLAMILIPTAMLGSFHGGRLTHRLPVRSIRIAFDVLLLVAGSRLVYGAIQQIV